MYGHLLFCDMVCYHKNKIYSKDCKNTKFNGLLNFHKVRSYFSLQEKA